MKRFTDYEIDIINLILEYHSKGDINSIYNWLVNGIIEPVRIRDINISFADMIHPQKYETQFYLNEIIDTGLSQHDFKIISEYFKGKIHLLVSLLEYLLSNDYIIFEKSKIDENMTLRTSSPSGNQMSDLFSKNIQEKLYIWDLGSFYPLGEKLEELKQNNYKTQEELLLELQIAENKKQTDKAKKAARNSFISMVISLITAFSALLAPLVSWRIHLDDKQDNSKSMVEKLSEIEGNIKSIQESIYILSKNDGILYTEVNKPVTTENRDKQTKDMNINVEIQTK